LIIFAFSLEEERESSQAARRADHIPGMPPYLTLWFKEKVRPLILWDICFCLPRISSQTGQFPLLTTLAWRITAGGSGWSSRALVRPRARREVHSLEVLKNDR
jgi:hypothetical protein